MDLEDLISQLQDPAAYPGQVPKVEVRQTHISVVFLTQEYAYKIKKPVHLDFVDYGTLERRRFFSEEEVRLNRRMAPEVYVGVVPITSRKGGGLQVEGKGHAVEWAVKMRRLPEEDSLLACLNSGHLSLDRLTAVARHIADFHARAERSESISALASFDQIARNARENLAHARREVGRTLSLGVCDRLTQATEAGLETLQRVIDLRAVRGVPCDGHGDLRLDHIYFLLKDGGYELTAIDCVEFNDRFRHADPVADAAFLSMDLAIHGRRDLALEFAAAYCTFSGDRAGFGLWRFYTSYRAAVRAKVASLAAAEPELPASQREAAAEKAAARWMLALVEAEPVDTRPCVVLVMGPPGTGKSALAANLARTSHFRVYRSDVVRKQLAGLDPPTPAKALFGQGLYSLEWTARTYAACFFKMAAGIYLGERVLIDATFPSDKMRRNFVRQAQVRGVPVAILVCQANASTIKARLKNRKGDPSDADLQIARMVAARWQPLSPGLERLTATINTDGDVEHVTQQAREALSRLLV